MKLRTMPSARPSSCVPTPFVCGRSSLTLIWIPRELLVQSPHPVNVMADSCTQDRSMASRTQKRAVGLFGRLPAHRNGGPRPGDVSLAGEVAAPRFGRLAAGGIDGRRGIDTGREPGGAEQDSGEPKRAGAVFHDW